MLSLVRDRDSQRQGRSLRVALWCVDVELADYIEQRLRRYWPEVSVERVESIEALAIRPPQVLVCGNEASVDLNVPTLWLGDVDRHPHPLRITPWIWKVAAPMTGRRLLGWVEAVLGAES